MKLNYIKNKIFLRVDEKYEEEFHKELIDTGILRGKIITSFLLIIEVIVLLSSLIFHDENFFEKPFIYYIIMYIIFIFIISIYMLIFFNAKNPKINVKTMNIFYSAIFFIVLWNAVISLLDQSSNGEIITYFTAVIGVGIMSAADPKSIAIILLSIHIPFLITLGFFQPSSSMIFSHYINSTIAVMISLITEWMLFESRIGNFINRKIIEEKNIELEKLSQLDGLTKIYNRLMFDKLIEVKWNDAIEKKEELSLIILDIDYFKLFNDNYGHQAGDQCLIKISRFIDEFSKSIGGFSARYGGEEFTVVMPYCNAEKAYELAEDIRIGIENLNILHDFSLISNHVTVSLGVNTIIPSPSDGIDEFVNNADKLLYRAKNESRNKTSSSLEIK